MIQENLENETQIRRFLLGELNEKERTALEEKFLADEDFFVQIRASEDDLIENYVRGSLSADEKAKFEKNFLTTKQRRQRVIFTQNLLGTLKTETAKKPETVSVWELIFGIIKQPKFAFGAAFAILALIFGFWLLAVKSPENHGELAEAITPTPTIQANQTLPQNQKVNENVAINADLPEKRKTNKTNSANANTETPEETPKKIVSNPVLALFAGTTRSEGKTSELNLPKNAVGANLHLNLESQDYQIYRAEIVDADGNVIYRSGKLKARNAKIYTTIPAKNLKHGDYLLKLYGLNSAGKEESAADFQFRVIRK